MSVFKPGDCVAGRFSVEALIGVGGMSEVYRGRDAKLHDRPVAIKVVHPGTPADPALRRRAEVEARSLSTLSHPHIAVLHDVCTHEGLDVLVMELVEGETLAARLRKGPLSEDTALTYAAQLADALACAHRQGVIHRDVKPSNIVVTAQGAKLLDFGLATLAPAAAPVGGPAAAAADAAHADAARAGTPFYMSPEQTAGLELDHRTDIYALGLVVCQMLTGFLPDAPSGLPTRTLIGGLLEQVASRPLRLVIERCLAADPDDRWRHAGDLHHALRVAAEVAERRPGSPQAHRPTAVRAMVAAALSALVGFGLVVAWQAARPSAPLREYQFALGPPPGMHFVSLETGGPAAVSPDGQTVAFVAADDRGTTSLWTRPLNGLDARPLHGTEGAAHPFWSPDSRFLAFFAAGRLQRIAAAGGPVRTIAPASQGRGGSWSPDGLIVFAPGFTEPLYRVPADGGEPMPVTALDFTARETSHRWPVFLPDGRRFLFFVRSDRPDVRGLYLGSVDAAARTRLDTIASSAVYGEAAGDGYLLFAHDGFLTAQRFSPAEGRLSGALTQIAVLPAPAEDTSVAPVSVSSTGVLVFGGGSVFRQELTWYDRAGRELATVAAQGQYRNVRLSPDARRVALERLDIRTGLANVWLFDIERNVQQRFDIADASFSPVWSPDGRSVLFALYRGAQWDLVQRGALDAADPKVLRTGTVQAPTDWSRDGKWIVYQEEGPGPQDQWDISALDVSTGATHPVVTTASNEHQGRISPDGAWLAYTSNESGRDEVYLQRFPAMPPRVRVSASGGSQPTWRADGRELVYVGPNLELASVTVDLTADPPRLSSSRTLLRVPMTPAAGILSVSTYDIDATADRIVVAAPPQAQNIHQQLTVVVNWPAEIAGR